MDRNTCNRARFVATDPGGHYESWFQRANHPSRPLAFWIRYTVFSPKDRPEDAVGELWAICFDGERGKHVALKQVLPIAACRFGDAGLDLDIGEAQLRDGRLQGAIVDRQRGALSWALSYAGGQQPLLLMPEKLYAGGFPKAKVLVGTPLASYSGALWVNEQRIDIDGWVGSQNHNWGSRHTDNYAWGQVAGFDEAPEAFLECSTARLKIGPLWTPPLSVAVLRLDGQEYRFDSLARSWRARAHFALGHWTMEHRAPGLRLTMQMRAARDDFVGLAYANPPGGVKTCLNTKIADCRLTLDREGMAPRTLQCSRRAAFEILGDEQLLPHSC
jgi:hypothetical protein